MKSLFQIYCLLPIFICGIFTSSSNALHHYILQEDNLEEVADAIALNYSQFSHDLILDFLVDHLDHAPIDLNTFMPRVNGIFSAHKKNISFTWKQAPQYEAYHISYLSLISGQTNSLQSTESSVNLSLDEDYNFHIFCFSTINQEMQSQINTFIVDRDLFSIHTDDSVEFPFEAELLNFHNFPNPFQGQTTLVFDLQQEGQVSIQLCSPENGLFLSDFFSPQNLPAGRREIPIDLSNYPSGLYFCLLKTDHYFAYLQLQNSLRNE